MLGQRWKKRNRWHKVGHSFIHFHININILIPVVCVIEDTRILKLAPIFQEVLLQLQLGKAY